MFGVLGILVGVLCVLFGVLGVLFGVLSVFFGVHYTFLACIIFIFFGVIGVSGIGMLYFYYLEFWMVHLIFSPQMMCRFVFLVSE